MDGGGNIYGLVADGPWDVGYRRAIRAAYPFIQGALVGEEFSPAELSHRRGTYPSVTFGISQGAGQTHPGRLDGRPHAGLVARLLADECLGRIAGFADCE